MTFLNPIALFGLLAASIPFILHLLNLKKLKIIDFSSIRFLKELQSKQIRKIEIRQWLLLILRTAIILLIALAFSRPAIESTSQLWNSNTHASSIIIIDNSQSMLRYNEKGKFIEQAKVFTNNILNSMKDGDEVLILPLSDLNDTLNLGFSKNIESLKKENGYLQSVFERKTIYDAVRFASTILDKSQNANKEIFVITDNQKSNLSDVFNFKTEENLFSNHTKLFFASLNNQSFKNVGIKNVEISSSILKPNIPFTAKVTISNLGDYKSSTLATIFINEKRVAQQICEIGPLSSKTIDFKIIAEKSGANIGRVEIETDELEADNKFYFNLNIQKNISVLVLNSLENEDVYLNAALKILSVKDSLQIISYNNLTPNKLTASVLLKNDVLIYSSVKDLSQNQNDLILNFIKNGGGVLILPNDITSLQNISSTFFNNSNDLSILNSDLPLSINNWDKSHPVFQGIFESNKNQSFDSPEIITYAFLQNEESVRPIAKMSNNKSFLFEKSIEKGILIFCAVGTNEDWSNISTKGIFVPLISQILFYISQKDNPIPQSIVGEKVNVTVPINDFTDGNKIIFIAPNKSETILSNFSQTSSSIKLQLPKTKTPGNYIIKNSSTENIISYNLNQKESEGEISSKQDILNSFTSLGIKKENIIFIDDETKISNNIYESRIGIELWIYFLFFALFLALIEMIISRTSKKEIL